MQLSIITKAYASETIITNAAFKNRMTGKFTVIIEQDNKTRSSDRQG